MQTSRCSKLRVGAARHAEVGRRRTKGDTATVTILLKRLGGATAANSFAASQETDQWVAPLPSDDFVASPVQPIEASNAPGLPVGEKPMPFGLPCITDEKLLMLMAQDSVNGRLAALHSTASPAASFIDDEPAAVPIAVGGSVTGVIDVAGDVDDVIVTLVAGQRYMISLMGSGDGALADSYLDIFDPSMVSLGHDDDGGVGKNSVMTITAAVSGTYTIRASAFGTSGVGQYTVDVRQMGTDSVPATIGAAVPIGQGITFGFRETAGPSGVGDSDYYKVSLVAGQTYSFSVAGGTDYESTFNPIAAGEIDTILHLRGPDGSILISNDDINYPSDASSTLQFTATSTGDYYLEVTAYPASAGPDGNTGGYVIDFRRIPPPDPLDSIDWGTAANIPTVMVDGVPTAYIYFAAAGENFGENALAGDPTQPASGGNGTLVSYGWTGYEKAQFMLAMQEYTKILGIAYVETADSALATFRVITNSSYAYGAYAYPQDPSYGTQRGIMVFNVDNRGWDLDSADPAVTTDGLGRGGFSWATILHEAGHAHGLAHPHDTGGGSTVMVGVTGPYSLGAFDLNQQIYTQMSYNDGWHTHPDGSLSNGDPSGWRADAGWSATMGAFDIAVLQARYGAAPAFAAGDNIYTLQDINAEGTYFETIYDTGGIDSIVYNGVHGAQIDLNTATLDYSATGGGIVSFVRNLPGQTTAQAIKGGFTIANGVLIENAAGGSGADVLIGNEAANVLTGNGGNDIVMGGGGNDLLTGGSGADSLNGGGDVDTADYSLETGGGAITVNLSGNPIFGANGLLLQPGEAFDSYGNVDTLANVENARTGSGNDTVRGNAGANRIETGGGRDMLFGGGGADFLDGGAGDDQYFVYAADSATFEDVIVELAGGGYDQIRTTLPSFSLADLPEIESLFGIIDIAFTLTGNDRDNYIIGNNGGDTLEGGLGNDKLEGQGGNDTMRGGPGDDQYVVNEIGDSVEENSGEGIDLVWTTLANYSLIGTNIEKLVAASAIAHDFRGNAFDNVIFGSTGNDNLRLHDGGDDEVYGADGNDNLFFIGSLTAADFVDGGAGNDTLILQGDYAGGLTLTANVTQIEIISILAGSNTNFGEPGTNRHDYVLTVNDANFSGAIQARINGSALLAGEDLTFDGSAELDSRFIVYGGRGRDSLTGSQNNDIFLFAEERFATGDTVNGGAGYDGLFLRGNYTIDFNAPGSTAPFTNIENLTLTSVTDERYARGGGTEFDYDIILSDAIVKPGETLTVSGTLLMANETMIVDAGAETDGFLNLFGGKAGDTLKGGALADLIHGSLGADQLTGNGGADVFRYNAAAESTSSSLDHILDFAAGVDKADLSRVDADSNVAGNQAFTWIGSNAFSGSAGQLRAYQDGSSWFVEGDTDGDGAADLVIQLTVTGGPLSQSDFLP